MAYTFNGINQVLSTTNAIADIPATLAGWFNADNTDSGYTIVYVGKSPSNDDRIGVVARGGVAGTPIRVFDSSNISVFADSTTSFSAANWSHAAGTYESNALRNSFFNGGSKGTNTTSISSRTAVWNALKIGSQDVLAQENYQLMLGKIAEVAIWSVALTDAEIASLAKGFKPTRIRPQSLVFYAPLLRNLQDLRAGLALTNNNSATVADHPRVY